MTADPAPLRKRVTRVNIARYAAASGDFNAQHLDEEHAHRIGLPSVIAHGLLTFGYAGQLLTDWCDGDPERVRRMRLRFLKPVFPNDELEVRGHVTGNSPDGVEVAIEIARGDENVAAGDATVAPFE
jgi:acyl dehydratase